MTHSIHMVYTCLPSQFFQSTNQHTLLAWPGQTEKINLVLIGLQGLSSLIGRLRVKSVKSAQTVAVDHLLSKESVILTGTAATA